MFLIKFKERNRTCCRFLFFCKLTAATVLKLCKEHFLTEKPGDEREWRSVTSRYHGSQISGSQQSFLTETAIGSSIGGTG